MVKSADSWRNPSSWPITTPWATVKDGQTLAEAIVDTVREPLVVLDRDLRVVAANRSFYQTFGVEP
jgi:PAS domain-containing protein